MQTHPAQVQELMVSLSVSGIQPWRNRKEESLVQALSAVVGWGAIGMLNPFPITHLNFSG